MDHPRFIVTRLEAAPMPAQTAAVVATAAQTLAEEEAL